MRPISDKDKKRRIEITGRKVGDANEFECLGKGEDFTCEFPAPEIDDSNEESEQHGPQAQ